jgi:hypothetical protein
MVRDVFVSNASATFDANVYNEYEINNVETIERIEDQGWILQDIGYVFQERGTGSAAGGEPCTALLRPPVRGSPPIRRDRSLGACRV